MKKSLQIRRFDRQYTFDLLGSFQFRAIANRTVPLSWRKRDHFPPSFIHPSESVCHANACRVGKWNAHTDEVKSPITINIDIRDTRRRLNFERGGNLARIHDINPRRRGRLSSNASGSLSCDLSWLIARAFRACLPGDTEISERRYEFQECS